jgi:hypothetical protein
MRTLFPLPLLGLMATAAFAASPADPIHVPHAQKKVTGTAQPNVLSPGFAEVVVAQGATALENPTPLLERYGYVADGPLFPAPGDIQAPGHHVEASKTEPDKNTYLILRHQTGADPTYDYGSRFLFQGHETGLGSITRINLDADGDHRVTLLADRDVNGQPLPTFDGSTWDPFAHRLLFTFEAGASGGVWQATLDVPSKVQDLGGILGRGGYEGIQVDALGHIWIVEDAGGKAGTLYPHAKQANSFIYRFIPKDITNLLAGGRLQALQVLSKAHAGAIVFNAADVDGQIRSQDLKDLHTYGTTFQVRWVTLHDSAVDGAVPYDANALAKAKSATPFKRPENGVFRPGSNFREFVYTETGDTNLLTEAGAEFGGFGGLMKVTLPHSGADQGTLNLLYRGDAAHTGLDNIAFWGEHHVVAVEDAGDGLHSQRNALDSAYLFDTRADYSQAGSEPIRILAQGRDDAATLDSGFLSMSGTGFQNEGDNEITGFHVSDGDPTSRGLLGAKIPTPFEDGWHVFYTQQHGDNRTWEIIRLNR